MSDVLDEIDRLENNIILFQKELFEDKQRSELLEQQVQILMETNEATMLGEENQRNNDPKRNQAENVIPATHQTTNSKGKRICPALFQDTQYQNLM